MDVSVQAQILNILLDIKEKENMSVLFISHDLAVVEHISDQVLVMYLVKVVESGPKYLSRASTSVYQGFAGIEAEGSSLGEIQAGSSQR